MKEPTPVTCRLAIFALPAILAVAVPPTHAGSVYDAAADFSPTNNPDGVWSYGSSTTLGSPFMLGNTHGNAFGIDYWVGDYTTTGPSITHNGTQKPVTFSSVTWDVGQLGFHPGPNGEYAIVRFTTPSTGTYSLDAGFIGLDFVGPTTTDVHIIINVSSIFDGNVAGFGPGSGPTFSEVLALHTGDTVDFAVGFGSDQDWGFDTTGLSATLTAVPEPAGLVQLGLGIFGLFTYGSLRRKSRLSSLI